MLGGGGGRCEVRERGEERERGAGQGVLNKRRRGWRLNNDIANGNNTIIFHFIYRVYVLLNYCTFRDHLKY